MSFKLTPPLGAGFTLAWTQSRRSNMRAIGVVHGREYDCAGCCWSAKAWISGVPGRQACLALCANDVLCARNNQDTIFRQNRQIESSIQQNYACCVAASLRQRTPTSNVKLQKLVQVRQKRHPGHAGNSERRFAKDRPMGASRRIVQPPGLANPRDKGIM